MRWDSSIDGASCFLRFACPQVVQGIAAFIFGKARSRYLYRDFLILLAGVEQTDDRVSIRFHFGEYLLVAGIRNSFCGDHILVNGEDRGVFKVLHIQLVEVCEIDAED